MSDDTGLIVARDGAILRITLNRPEKLNAVTVAVADAMLDTFKRAASDDGIRVVVLDANGRAFCAGQDLADPAVAPGSDLGHTIQNHYNPVIRAMRSLDKPIVASVNGVAAGAGANLAFACDLVLAARSATFIESFARIGLVPDSGGTWMLPRLIGYARATGLAMLGDKITAQQALEWGAIWGVIDDEGLSDAVDTLAKMLAVAPTRAIGAIKSALNNAWGNTFDVQLDLERDLQSKLGHTTDYSEGVAAFREKRTPIFTGN